MRHLILLTLILVTTTTHALNVTDERRYVCKQGNCVNGQGSVWDALLSITIQGNWINGNTIPDATYTVTVPIAPDKKFKQIYGQDGLLKSGDQPRASGSYGNAPSFRGNYESMVHPFMRLPMAVIKRGVYDTDMGVKYHGRFEYLAAKSGMNTGWGSGFYIFYGDRIDTEENEKETGLFISDEAMSGLAVRFVKADPSYLAIMQKRYQQDMQIAKGDFAQQESERKWRIALAVIGKVAYTLASGGTNLASSNGLGADIAMNLVSGIFNKGEGGLNVKELALQAIGSAVLGDQQLGSALGKAVSEGIDEANKK